MKWQIPWKLQVNLILEREMEKPSSPIFIVEIEIFI